MTADEQNRADRRCNVSKAHIEDQHNAELDLRHAKAGSDGQEDRGENQDGRGDVHEHADDQFGKDYIQNAGTAAIRKALGNCGFGTPANAEYIEGVTVCHEAAELTDAPVDDGVEAKIPVPPVPKEVVEAEKNEKKTATRTRKTAKKQEQPKEAAPVETSPQTESEPKPEPKSEPAHTPIPVPPVPREQEAVKEPKTLEEALSFKIPCGRYGGQTMKELLDSGNTAAITYFLRPLFTGKPVQAAARILAGQYNL